MPSDTAALVPKGFQQTEFGAVPVGWRVASAYEVSSVVYGAPFKSALFNSVGDGVPLIRIRDLGNEDPNVFTTESHAKGYLVQPGDLLVGMDGEFRPHLWRGPSAWLNQRVCCFKPNPGIPRAFVHYSIEALLNFFESSKTGTTVIHLGKSDIDTFRILVPQAAVMAAFGKVADPIDSLAVVKSAESRTLAAIRDALLPKLISGEIRVKDAEKMMGQAV
jgi:type I restriction enzyme S subunit